jgi:hypothetical protein
VIVGDFNSHCEFSGFDSSDPKGRYLADLAEQNCFVLLNNKLTTRIGQLCQRDSVLDLASPSLASRAITSSQIITSDHI